MSRPQCPRCLRPQTHCLCPLIPSLDSRTLVLLLQHPSEVNHALNTARLAALGLINAELIVGEVFEDLPALLNRPGYQARLLFPADDAQPMQAYGESDEPLLCKAINWLLYPLLYCFYILIRGAMSNYYPYSFIDGTKLTYSQITVNCFFLLLAFLTLGLLFIGISRRAQKG
jgi:hypothetical protein